VAPRDIVTTPRPATLDDVRTLLERAVALGGYTASPADWRDEVLYFLLPDRFSDGREDRRELLTMTRRAALRTTPARPDIDWREWAASGARWQGGTIGGIRSRLDYLQGLGVTTVWIGPVFKQRAGLDAFHGYGVQDFLDVDPRLGTRQDLADLCENAHARGLRIILDIVVTHAADNEGEALSALVDCYRYWIAASDCDGFRLDTATHLSLEDARNLCGALREFADRIGKRNFLIVGEMAGGNDAPDFFIDHLAAARRNLSAALDGGGARRLLGDVAKGLRPAADYFGAFDRASRGFESHRAFGDRHVSILDDHDPVFGRTVRFSADIPDASPVKDRHIVAATAIQLFALGLPCLYYGSEQAFAGPAASQRPFLTDLGWGRDDRYLREAMFGPAHPRAAHAADLETQVHERDETLPGFGPFGTFDTHAFDPTHPAYRRIAALCATRARHPVLRAGRQYQRAIRVFGDFALPAAGELVAWSRILDTDEAVVIVNPNGEAARGGQIVVSSELSRIGDEFLVVVNTAEAGAGPGPFTGSHPIGSRLTVRGRRFAGEPAFVAIDPVPPAEVLVLMKHQA
jgi:glycosidase